ncbi:MULTISPECIES: hypothetical protein [Microbacterium]|jgi:hypothetical protein|uniref:hypothetical protein n=1 Tax=Microbacterium TaxID=33882 RepID=UPI001E418EB8|nr:hypothetical protein [Microbacterium nymphoidis]MCD2497818.1 hypothetical protein [Microbacterium nymphoidis]
MRALQQALLGGGTLLIVLGIALMLIDVSRMMGIGVTIIGAAAMGASLAISMRAPRDDDRRGPRPRP